MKLSARNVLKGKVVAVIKGVTTANIKLDLGNGIVITSSITMEAAKELKLKKGDKAYAIIKASEVIVGKE
jgi:molybdopterin-binding protein